MDTVPRQRSNLFLIVYMSIVLLDLLFGSMGHDGLRLLSKPMILVSLILYFGSNGRSLPKNIFVYTLAALCFSLLGDIMLLFDHGSPSFFMFGLLAFLLAHISYTLVFIKQGSAGTANGFWWVLAALVSYGLALYLILMDHLGGLKLPVIIYILAILVMALTAYNRKGEIKNYGFRSVLIGALLFILSDSILALNKFLFAVPGSHILVMGTYAAAQYMIVCGLLGSKGQNISRLG